MAFLLNKPSSVLSKDSLCYSHCWFSVRVSAALIMVSQPCRNFILLNSPSTHTKPLTPLHSPAEVTGVPKSTLPRRINLRETHTSASTTKVPEASVVGCTDELVSSVAWNLFCCTYAERQRGRDWNRTPTCSIMKKRKTKKETAVRPKWANAFYGSLLVAVLCAVTVAFAFHRLKVGFWNVQNKN